MKLAFILLVVPLLFISPSLAQTPRYPVSPTHITDLKQASSMLQEFTGDRGVAFLSHVADDSVAMLGKLEITNTGIQLVLDRAYAGPGVIETVRVPQKFLFSHILVGKDTVDSGALFSAQFLKKTSIATVTLNLRFYSTGRAVGVALLTDAKGADLDGYIVISQAATDASAFSTFMDEAARVYVLAGHGNPVVVFSDWAAKKPLPTTK